MYTLCIHTYTNPAADAPPITQNVCAPGSPAGDPAAATTCSRSCRSTPPACSLPGQNRQRAVKRLPRPQHSTIGKRLVWRTRRRLNSPGAARTGVEQRNDLVPLELVLHGGVLRQQHLGTRGRSIVQPLRRRAPRFATESTARRGAERRCGARSSSTSVFFGWYVE